MENKPKTIREMVADFQNEIATTDLQPQRAAEILTKLAALSGNINAEILKCDVAYNQKLLECYDSERKANRAKIQAECSEEFIAKQEARNIRELTTELIRSLKYFLKEKEEERRQARFQ